MASNRFQNKIALVTGGNSGIDLAAAQAFAKEGARVVVAGRDPKTLEQAKASIGANAIVVQADVAKLADIDRVIAETAKLSGRI